MKQGFREATLENAAQSSGMVYGPVQADGSRRVFSPQDVVGKRVTVEGIAWGQPFGARGQEGTVSPFAGPQVIHQGGAIFVKGVDFAGAGVRGKAVRVTGTLRLEPELVVRHAPAAGLKPYYYIDAASFVPVDAEKDPYPVVR